MLGDFFAVLAAASNGTIGIFNRYGFAAESNYINLAFYKCVGAFLLLTCFVLMRPHLRQELISHRRDASKLAVLSFFGVFVLYFFETWAFSLTSIPVVSFLTYASGIVAIVLGIVFLRESVSLVKIVSIILVFAGVYLMFNGLQNWDKEAAGAILAIIGGTGYSIFLFLWRKFAVPSGLATLCWFFGFGTIFLGIPFFIQGAELPDTATLPSIFALIIIPTIGGYYFTSRALSLTEASRVQVIETSDPLFSSLFAFVLFGDALSGRGFIGAICILTGLVLLVVVPILRAKFRTEPKTIA